VRSTVRPGLAYTDAYAFDPLTGKVGRREKVGRQPPVPPPTDRHEFLLELLERDFVHVFHDRSAPSTRRRGGFRSRSDRWTAAVVPTQILAVAGLAAVVGTGGGPLLMAAGKPRWLVIINLVGLLYFSVVVYLAARLGVVWVALSVAAYQVSITLAVQVLIERLVEVPVRALIHDIGPAFPSAVTLFAVGFPLMKLLSMAGIPAPLVMVTVAAIGLGLYAGMMRMLFRAAWDDLMLVCATVIPRMPALHRRSATVNTQPPLRAGEPISRSHVAR
jgi:hypothetical protein